MGDGSAVQAAVDALVAAFAEGRMDDYFGAFALDCTFIFHTAERRLPSVAAYRELWARWVAEDGFTVLSCRTSDPDIRLFGDIAIVTHDVATRVRIAGEEQDLRERETIALHRVEGQWLGVHEHLSPAP